jgi:hypothetical protein
MNTATLKFAAIYNAIERNPPSGSSPDDWLEAAKTNYQDQTKGTAFNALSAWQKLRHAPKWRADARVDQPSTPRALPIPTSDSIDPNESLSNTPASSSSRPIGGKAAKRLRIEGYAHDELVSKASEFAEISQERLGALLKGNEILTAKNELLKEKNQIEEKLLELEQEKIKIEKEHRRSETQMNDIKMLRESVDIDDDEAKEVLKIIKDEIKNKWRGRA